MQTSRYRLISILAATILVTGCESSPSAATLDGALKAYDSGQFETANRQAVALAETTQAIDRDRAIYIAGLSAYRMGQDDQAETYLSGAATSPDNETAGKAMATLAMIRLDRHRPDEAAELFEQAAQRLEGADQRQSTNRAHDARAQAAIAGGGGGGGGVYGQFALQVGAFRDRTSAQRVAEEAGNLTRGQGFGPARIVSRSDPRFDTLYVVQVGSFATRSAADAARTRLGRLEYRVSPYAAAVR